MNQILFTGENNKKLEINKVVLFFVVIIIIFAFFLIGQGIFFLSKRTGPKIIKWQESTRPEVIANAEGNSVEIKIKNNIEIEKVYYSWKNGEENEIDDVTGKKEVEKTVFLPNEDTTLNIRIIDKNNEEFKISKDFKYNSEIDVAKPKVELTSTTGNVIITVTDNKEISYIEYNWNEEDAIRVKPNEDQKVKMEVKIPVKQGLNDFTVLAVDSSGNTASATKKVQTVGKPKIELKKSKGEIIIKVTDDEEVTKVVYEINGSIFTRENTGENKKSFEIRDLLVKGENIIKVTAYNKAGETAEKIGKCTY